MFVKKILMIMTALFLFCGCAAKPVKTSATSVEQAKTKEKQNFSVSENADQKHAEQVSKDKKKALNTPSEKESAKAEKEKGKAVSKTEKKSKSKKNTVSSEKKVSSSPVISEDTSDSHIHDWVHHKATGHYDTKVVTDQNAYDEVITPAWDEPARHIVVCNGCGQRFEGDSADDQFMEHILGGEWPAGDNSRSHNEDVAAIHHDAVTKHHDAVTHTEQIWIQDSAAYDECSICGVKK